MSFTKKHFLLCNFKKKWCLWKAVSCLKLSFSLANSIHYNLCENTEVETPASVCSALFSFSISVDREWLIHVSDMIAIQKTLRDDSCASGRIVSLYAELFESLWQRQKIGCLSWNRTALLSFLIRLPLLSLVGWQIYQFHLVPGWLIARFSHS